MRPAGRQFDMPVIDEYKTSQSIHRISLFINHFPFNTTINYLFIFIFLLQFLFIFPEIVQYNFPVQSCIRFPFLSITFLSIRVDKYFFIIFVSSEFNVCTCSPSEHFLHRGSCPV
uniref:Uncharacterized protein n=2 Tax=Cacopsylla melanoneura TaxID=428564 RepID=A0A8D9ECE9_9HEMI